MTLGLSKTATHKVAVLLLLLVGLTQVRCASTGAATPSPLSNLPVLQGYTNSNSTQFSVLAPKGKKLRYFVRAESAENDFEVREIEVQRFEKDYSSWVVDRIWVSGLEVSRPYRLEIYDAFDTLIDAREFYALDTTRPQVKFAAASCMDESFVLEQKQIWPELLSRSPQMLFFLGDNVYASKTKGFFGHTNEKKIWGKYVHVRLQLEIFRSPKLIPTLAIWDDGDYGQNNGDRDSHVRRAATEVFQIFYAQEPDMKNLFSGPGVARWFKAFEMNFALMDNRSFRSPSSEKSPDEQTHWGFAQENWLHQNLKDSLLPTWILNGDQIFGGYHRFESYERERPDSLATQLKVLGSLPQPILFLTGDRHLTEVMKIDAAGTALPTFEITTSPLHARTYPSHWEIAPNPNQVEGRVEKFNYMIIEARNKGGSLSANLTSYSLNSEILFHRFISVEKTSKKLITK